MGDSAVIGFEPGKGRDETGGANVDDGDPKGAEGFGDGGIFDAGDDAGAIPGGEPGGCFVAAGVFGEMDGPGAAFADESDDAAEEAASVGVRGLDEQGDFRGGVQPSKRVIGMELIEIAKNHPDQSQMHIGDGAKIEGEMRGISWFGRV